MALTKLERRARIKMRIRKVVNGSAQKPRMSVFRSNKQIYVQFIDDLNGPAPADKRTVLFGPEFDSKGKITFKREGLTENPRAIWEQRIKIHNT